MTEYHDRYINEACIAIHKMSRHFHLSNKNNLHVMLIDGSSNNQN